MITVSPHELAGSVYVHTPQGYNLSECAQTEIPAQ